MDRFCETFMDENIIDLGKNCTWNKTQCIFFQNKTEVYLTLSETKLLETFIKNINRRIHSTDLYFSVHEDFDKEYSEKSVRNLISSLRKKIEPLRITNIYGGYYMLRREQEYFDKDFQEYLYEIFDQSSNVIIITDPNQSDNPIIYVNNAFKELFGYSFEEVKGKNCRFLHANDHDQEALVKVRKALAAEEAVDVILHNYTNKGTLLKCELTISPIFDKENGRIKYFLGINKEFGSAM